MPHAGPGCSSTSFGDPRVDRRSVSDAPVRSENQSENQHDEGVTVTQRSVKIETSDGICPGALSLPVGEGPWPAVIMFADAGGMRDTMREMGERLSDQGYVVLVPDFYYRNGPYDPVDMRTAFSSKDSAEMIIGMMRGYTADLAVRDASAFVDYLDSRPETKPGGVGTTGYCMGGRLSLITAANLSEHIAVAASFHGGNLANADDPDSPHHKANAIKAAVYVAGAIQDQSFSDEQKDLLEKSLSEAGVIHTIETYQAHHGFAVPDNPSYDSDAAERHWKAMEQFFGSVLA
jgi:carboxymethylenebutenolidase